MAFSNCSRSQKLAATDIKGQKLKTFATVGDVELPGSMVDKAIEGQMQQSQLPPDILESLPPEYRIQMVTGGVTRAIQAAHMFEAAKRVGYKTDDDSVKKALHFSSEKEFIDLLIESAKKSGQLKPDATVKDLEELAKSELKGKTLSDVYKEKLAELNGLLADSQKSIELKLGAGQQFLIEKFSAGVNPTDDEVKKSFETYQVKRILFKSAAPSNDAAAKVKADKAYADLKANKSFEDVMDASSEEMNPDPKKKKSENIANLGLDMIERLPDFKPVLKLEPSAYSGVEKVTEGYAILKFVGKKLDVPKDFDAKKAQFKQDFISKQVQKKVKDELDKIEKEVKPSFEIKAYEAAYRYQKAMSLPAGTAQDQEIRAVFDLAATVKDSDDKPDVAAMVRVITIQRLYDMPGSDKTKLKEDRIAALENYLNFSNSWPYRKEVIDAYKDKRDKTKAIEQLQTGLDKNTKFDSQAQGTFSDISAKFVELKSAGLVSAEQEKEFNTKRDQWRSDKDKYDKEEALQKKQMEEEAKKAAEEAKKAKAKTPAPTLPKKSPGK